MLTPTMSEFKRLINGRIALVDFDVPWYASSRIQEGIIHSLAWKFCESALIVAVDVHKIQHIAVKFSIHHVPTPTLILFKKGKEIRRFVGIQSEETLCAAVCDAIRTL